MQKWHYCILSHADFNIWEYFVIHETQQKMALASKMIPELNGGRKQLFRDKLRQLAECDEIVSTETVNAIGNVMKDMEMAENNVSSSDEFDEDLEEEFQNLNDILDLPHDTYSLTEIKPELPSCVKYVMRSGVAHLNMPRFSPLSRGYQVIASQKQELKIHMQLDVACAVSHFSALITGWRYSDCSFRYDCD